MNVILSDYVEPDYGLIYPVEMNFIWNNDVISYGLKEQRNQLWSRPKRYWIITWGGLKAAARARLNEIFNRAAGRFQTFLWSDRDDYACGFADWSYTATGGEETTQLQKIYHKEEDEAWIEDKKDIVSGEIYAPTIKIGDVAKTEDVHFTLDDSTGIINWLGGSLPNGPLSAGQVITADYHFYFRVRFETDILRDIQTSKDFYKPDFILIEVVS